MEDLYHKVRQQLKPGRNIYIEFEKGKVSVFSVFTEDKHGCNSWDPSEEKIDSLLITSGLDRTDLDTPWMTFIASQ